MPADAVRVLLVEDDPEDYEITRGLFAALDREAFRLDRAATYEEGLEAMARQEHDVYLLDYRLGAHTGAELLRAARARGWAGPIIMLTGQGDRATDLEAMRGGADDYLTKGRVNAELLERALRYALERARATRALRDSELRLRAVFEGTRDALVITDSEGQYLLEANPAACALFGLAREQMIGRTLASFAAAGPGVRPLSPGAPVGGRVRGEMRLLRQDGARDLEFLVTPHFLPGYDLAVLRDVTDSKHLEEQYHRLEALGDVGRLAAGVAGELHRLLADLGRTHEALRSALPTDARPRRLADEAGQTGERAAALARQFLALAGEPPSRPGVPDLNLLVAGLGESLLRLLGGAVQLTLALDPAPKPVRAEAGQVEHVVLNLAAHARAAMPAGGKLTLETGTVEVADGDARPHPHLHPGRYVLLEARDTGRGLDEKARERLDEVLASGRAPDPRDGPGLPAACHLVRQLGGVLAVYSEPDLGTCCAAYLPRAAEGTAPVPSERPNPATRDGGLP
jgi:signal transduction histidine kinase